MKLKPGLLIVSGMAFLIAIAWASLAAGKFLVHHFSLNSAWRAERALIDQEPERAQVIASARIRQEYYDFASLRQLAHAQMMQKEYGAATETLFVTIRRERQADGRSVYTIEPDISKDYRMLRETWKLQGKFALANEAARISEALALRESIPTLPLKGRATPPGTHVPFPLQELHVSDKAGLTTVGIRMTGNGEIAGTTSTQSAPVAFQVSLSGTPLGGIYPIVELWINGIETAHLYADAPRELTIPLDGISTGTFSFKLRYINDAYEPATRADRNLIVSGLALVEAP